jgi:hypothetical protein
MLKHAVKLLFNTLAPGGTIGPHGTYDKELMVAGVKPITLMGDYEGVEITADTDPTIKKWADDFHELSYMADQGQLLRQDITLTNPNNQEIKLVLFGQHGQEEPMQKIIDAYEWEENGCQGPEPTEDMGIHLGYSEADVKLWNVMNATLRYAPFLAGAVNDYMTEVNVPRRDANVQRMLDDAQNKSSPIFSAPHPPI